MRIDNTNREEVTLFLFLFHYIWHLIHSVTQVYFQMTKFEAWSILRQNDFLSKHPCCHSALDEGEEDSCDPLAQALIFWEFITFMADINFENLMSKSFHRWAN